jgi:hypothetical protein
MSIDAAAVVLEAQARGASGQALADAVRAARVAAVAAGLTDTTRG